MRVAPPALLPILRSGLQGEILAATYLSPNHEFHITELAKLAGADPTNEPIVVTGSAPGPLFCITT